MRAALRIPAMVVWLTVLWIALWGGISWANALSGLAIAVTVTAVAHTGSASRHVSWFRPYWAAWYVLVVSGKLVESNLRLAWEILTPGIGTHTAIIAVPMRGGSDSVVNLVANSITLTPGTMTVDVVVHDLHHLEHPDQDLHRNVDDGDSIPARVTLYVHGMYAQDPEQVRHEILELEALALRAFGSPDDYLHAEADVVEHIPLLDHTLAPRAERRVQRRSTRGRRREELIEMGRRHSDAVGSDEPTDEDRS